MKKAALREPKTEFHQNIARFGVVLLKNSQNSRELIITGVKKTTLEGGC